MGGPFIAFSHWNGGRGGPGWTAPGKVGYAYELRADEPARISDTITPSGSVPQ